MQGLWYVVCGEEEYAEDGCKGDVDLFLDPCKYVISFSSLDDVAIYDLSRENGHVAALVHCRGQCPP